MGERAGTLVILGLLVFGLLMRSTPGMGRTDQVSIIPQVPVDPVHKTYWLIGSNAGNPPYNWNNSGLNPGPLLTASDGDNVTLMLQSGEGDRHNWYLAFDNDTDPPDPNELGTKSHDFFLQTSWLNWTFTAHLGSIMPHGGTFAYKCQYHASMYGYFKFYAGPVASFTHSPTTPLVGHTVSFDASTSWPSTDATIVSYKWDFGDGSPNSFGRTVSHSYSTNKTYTVILNLTDSVSQSVLVSQAVTVLNPPPVPFNYTLQMTPPSAKIVRGQTTNATVNLTLTSGVSENVTLSSTVFPNDPSIIVSFNGSASKSGFPSYSASMKITTSSAPNGTYTVTVIALSSTGVAHNATFLLTLTPLPPVCNGYGCGPSILGYIIYGAIIFAFVMTVVLVYRRGRKKMNLRRAEAAELTS